MKNVIEYIDDLKGVFGSDYASAKALQITKESVSKIRSRGQMSDETAIKIADLLGIEREEVLISAAIARSKEGEVKDAWVKFAQNWGYRASFALVAGTVAPALIRGIMADINSVICILC